MAITYTGTGPGGAIDPAVDDWTPVQGEQVRQDLVGLDTRVSDVEAVIDAGFGTGNVVGPASSTDNAIAVYDGTTGKLLKNSGMTVAGAGALSGTNTGDVSVTGQSYLSRVGQLLTASLINLASHVTGRLPFANLVAATAAVRLLGRGTGAGGGDWHEILLGSYLKMTGNVLDVETSGLGGGGAPTNASYVTLATDPTLTNERALAAGTGIALVDNGAGNTIEIHATPQAGAQNTYLVTGGQVVWIADYEFLVSAATYFILGSLYDSAQDTVTLGAAHATLDRIDVIAVDDAGAVVVVAGTAAAQPSEPDVDPGTQLKLGIVYVAAASTAPSGAASTLLYAENAGSGGSPAEWDWTTSGTGFNVDSTNNPRTGSKTIEGTTVANGAYAQGQIGSGTIDPNASLQLVLYIRSKATWNNNRGLAITFRASGVTVGSAVNILRSGTWAFDSSNTTDYQLVAIPISAFAIPADTIANQLRIADFGGSIGFYIDDISIQGGATTQTPTSGLTKEQADVYYAPNLGLASQAEAEAGTEPTKYMTPLRVAQAIAAQAPGGGAGDVVGPASSVDAEIALFDSTTGKLIKRATGTGFVRAASGVYSAAKLKRVVGAFIGDGVNVISTGVAGFVSCPVAGVITKVRLLSSDQAVTSGSIVVDIWKDTYANYPPTVGDTITASAKPTISSATKSEDATLTGWTASVVEGDVFGFNVDSVTSLRRVAVEITIEE